MEAVCTSESSVSFNVTTRRYIPEDYKLLFYLRIYTVICEQQTFFYYDTIPLNPGYQLSESRDAIYEGD
jgi:hypothetical protein